jgi:hypothetical protein
MGAIVAAIATACAQGTQTDGTAGSGGGVSSGGTGSGTGGSGAGPAKGEIGGPCDTTDDCTDGTCTALGDGKYCTVPCPPGCPTGTYCALVQGDSICVPDKNAYCAQCNTAADCKEPADGCLTAPLGDKFCARDCTTLGQCPNGFTCVDANEYKNGGPGSGGGSADASADGSADAAADASHPSGVPYKFCVPSGGLSCPCNSKRDGVKHSCSESNQYGTCGGTETCDGDQAKWAGCTATTPAAETCNGKDDDCDMQTDDGDPNDLCKVQGPPPAHSAWACTAGKCSLGKCDAGWAAYPGGSEKAGCNCAVDLGEPNGTCASATGGGTISDSGGSITMSGTLSAANDVDFWQFDTTDTNEASTNSYHVSLSFTAPAMNDEFVMDVMRGAACNDAPSGPSTGITSYDWCVNGKSADGTKGEGPCGPTAPAHCTDHSSKYFVRVYRKLGATGTCTQYTITATAKGGACDFTQQCSP